MKPDVVLDYAEDMAAGATFPPVEVYYDGSIYWLADGYLTQMDRYHAWQRRYHDGAQS